MRKLVMLALSLGAIAIFKRRALRSGLPLAVVTALANGASTWIRSPEGETPAKDDSGDDDDEPLN